jgi:WD40 repeat protein
MLKGHAEPVTVVAYQHRGFLLASGGQDGRLCVWQPANRAPMIGAVTFEATDISDLAWSPDDRSLFAGSGQGTVGLFQVT